MVSSLGPFQDSDEALSEALRVLRTRGKLVAVTWGDDYRELDLTQESRARAGLPPRPTTSGSELARRLRRAGYRSVEIRDVRMPVAHDSVAAYLAYRQAFGPVPDLGASDLAALLGTLADCAASYTDRAGRVLLDWHLLVMSAKR